MHASKHKAAGAKGRFGVVSACALLACIPTAGLALGGIGSGIALPTARATIGQFTPASIDPRIAQLVARNSTGKARLMRFTPAGVSDRTSRSVTVAVRVDEAAARAITVSSTVAANELAGAPALRIAPVRYSLGLARGYQSFAKTAVPAAAASPTLSRSLSEAAIPDLATYKPSAGVREDPSRFTPRNPASEPRPAAAARVVEAHEPADQAVDVAGSYRLTRNLDVTAGVRYSQERDRLAPVADTAKLDNQAVYIGTQFRF